MILKSIMESGLFFTDFSVFIPIFAGVLTGAFHITIFLITFGWLRKRNMKNFGKWLLRSSVFRFLVTVTMIIALARFFEERALIYIITVVISYSTFLAIEIRQLKQTLDHNSLPNG